MEAATGSASTVSAGRSTSPAFAWPMAIRSASRQDWAGTGPKRQFLRHLARRACDYFSVVLTPDSDADHHDHIHLDIGPDRRCSV
jgi:hypothetical protein